MNFFQKLMQNLFGTKRGEADYRGAIEIGKVIAPVAAPFVANVLASKGLPPTGQAALSVLMQVASGQASLSQVAVDSLAGYLSQHINLVAPAPPTK